MQVNHPNPNIPTKPRRKMRRLTKIVLWVVAVVVVVFVIAIVTGPPTPPPAAPVAPTATAPAPPDTAAFIAGLHGINPALVADEERAILRAGNVCLDLAAGTDPATIAGNTAQRFTGGGVEVDQDQAARIVELARVNLCRQ